MTIESRKKGKEIEEHLSSVNMDPWYYIYENFVKNDFKEKLKKDSSEKVS
ncbi:MAG: hypothetical protein OEM77_08150 [Nitrosopumilus sp.]|nr:hypothetical protein [Nitrosopumilus sp.]MDH3779605.1 hypothetical protein [Nitrosopumilus sp.]MDH3854709.1 hypothetical protein [Nitrosopumilus sp.]